MIQPGQLDEQVTPQVATTTVVRGERVDSWVPGAPVWARVDEQPGREVLRAGQVDGRQNVLVTMRYPDSAALTSADRLVRGSGAVLQIISVRDIGRGQMRELLCQTGPEA